MVVVVVVLYLFKPFSCIKTKSATGSDLAGSQGGKGCCWSLGYGFFCRLGFKWWWLGGREAVVVVIDRIRDYTMPTFFFLSICPYQTHMRLVFFSQESIYCGSILCCLYDGERFCKLCPSPYVPRALE